MLKKVAGVVVSISPMAVFAAGPDMSGLTSAVDFGTVTTAVLSVAGMLAIVHVAVKGAKLAIGMLKTG